MKTVEQLVGYAAKFNQFSQPIGGNFIEIIRPGAFKKTIAKDDIRALINHDSNGLIGRNRAGTLRLEEDSVGLKIMIHPPDTDWGRGVLESIKRGDLTGMSFAFAVPIGGDRWLRPPKGGNLPIRELLEVQLFEVSPVTFPAYLSSSISVVGGSTGRSVTQHSPSADSQRIGWPALGVRRRRLELLRLELCA